MRRTGIGAVLAGVLLLTACGSGDDPSATTSPTSARPSATRTEPAPTASSPAASPVDTATPDPSTSASSTPTSAPLAPLVDYGSVLAVWATRHVPDERFDPGAMWDATPGWGPDEDNNDKFNDVVLTGGRVLDYVMYLPRPSVTAAKATALALTALPKDATLLWKQQFASCSVVQLTSASLARAVAGKPFSNPQGQVQLVLRSGTALAPSASFDPASVASVLVRSTQAATAGDFAGC